MRPLIEPAMTVGALLEAYPQAEQVLIDLAPAFAKLRNPVVRRTVAKVATLEQAAKIGGVDLQTMIVRLGGSCVQSAARVDDPGGPPEWVVRGRVVEEIDAEAMLDRGVHPIGKVRDAVKVLQAGELILLRAPFRPQPLIDTMTAAGRRVYCAQEGQRHAVYFGRER